MTATFDHIAGIYDQEFTHSAVGALQRQKVWDYLDQVMHAHHLSVLELNCGTGEDAIHLAAQEHEVLATDLSEEMLTVAHSKAKKMGFEDQISFLKCDINDIEKIDFNRKFDLILSNFGGLNCVDAMALKKLSKVASRLLKSNGRFIGVIMPGFCLWESLYFLGKARGTQIFRRSLKNPLQVNINGQNIETWYYGPHRIKKIFKDEFRLVGLKPVGFFLPPSYLQKFFGRREKFLNYLDQLEDSVNHFSSLAGYSDHFLIDLELKTTTTS